eukprot:3033597-Rhodomonas_salina.3
MVLPGFDTSRLPAQVNSAMRLRARYAIPGTDDSGFKCEDTRRWYKAYCTSVFLELIWGGLVRAGSVGHGAWVRGSQSRS